MIRVFNVPVQVYQACGIYASETGEEVYVNDLCIGEDSRAFIHSITVEDGELIFTPVYLTSDKHKTVMARCKEDEVKIEKFVKAKKEAHNVR